MRKIAVLMALTSLMAVGGVQAESGKGQKDECLLYSEKCAGQAATLQQKIQTLQDEIKKGKVYNPKELKKLERKLKEANDLLNSITKEAPSVSK